MGFGLGGIGGCCCAPAGPCLCSVNGAYFPTNGCSVTLPGTVLTPTSPSFLACCSSYDGATLFLPGASQNCGTLSALTTSPYDGICGFAHVVDFANFHIGTFDTAYCTLRYNLYRQTSPGLGGLITWAKFGLKGSFDVSPGQIHTLSFHSASATVNCALVSSPGDVTVEIL